MKPQAPGPGPANPWRRLTASEAERHYPVKLTGVLTFFDGEQFYHFIQDETAGVYFDISGGLTNVPLAAGMREVPIPHSAFPILRDSAFRIPPFFLSAQKRFDRGRERWLTSLQ